jgi:hypothetical protein
MALLLALPLGNLAARPAPLLAQDEPRKDVLFDGKTLDGWKAADFYGAGEVSVQDGAILMKRGTKMTGFTTTLKDLPTTNYELSYEARRIDGNDFFAAATFPVGNSFITLVNGGWGGSVTGLSSLDGSDASENDTSRFFKYENGKWYRFRVWVTDKTIRAWVDDTAVVRVNIEARHVSTRIETRRNQPLGFATYESTGSIRAIEIRPLSAKEVEESNQPIE